MNSPPAGKQGFLAQLLMGIRRLEKAKLCEIVGGLVEPPDSLEAFSMASGGLIVSFDNPLPVGSFANHWESAEGPSTSFEAHLPLKESLLSCDIDGVQVPKLAEAANGLE